MFRGTVSTRLEPKIVLEVLDKDGQPQAIETIVDTGFDGDLSLPRTFIEQLGYQPFDDFLSTLADGSDIAVTGYEGRIIWHGRPWRAIMLETEGDALLGMHLLWRNRITIDNYANGPVVIEELE